jgi:hypothetical protein
MYPSFLLVLLGAWDVGGFDGGGKEYIQKFGLENTVKPKIPADDSKM